MKDRITSLKKTTAKNINATDRVTFSLSDNSLGFPFIINTDYPDINISVWINNNKTLIDSRLEEYGAVLFKGFQINSIEKFQQFVMYFGQDALEYKLRSSPRHAIGEKVYVSTVYPPEYSINMHSESSYSPFHPKKIAFCCIEPAIEGGNTPIADNRLVLKQISEKTKEKFETLEIKYRRFFSGNAGVPWQEAFQTDDKKILESECRSMGIDFKWINEKDLILVWNKKAIWNHPRTGDLVWFNHALFFNKYAPGYEDLNSLFDEDALPNNTFFGDGTEIVKEEINEIAEAYKKATVRFKWEKGDVLLLDNMLMSHGRDPFKGSRNIVVTMA